MKADTPAQATPYRVIVNRSAYGEPSRRVTVDGTTVENLDRDGFRATRPGWADHAATEGSPYMAIRTMFHSAGYTVLQIIPLNQAAE